MTENEIEKKINDVLTGRADELVIHTMAGDDFTLYEREIGNYELKPMGHPQSKPWYGEIVCWSLQVEGLPYPVYFTDIETR